MSAPCAFTTKVDVSSSNAEALGASSVQTITGTLRITRWLRLRLDSGPISVGLRGGI
jgi:hypothetical protein